METVDQMSATNGKGFDCIVCADTGADHCVFPISFAGALGLDPLTMPKELTGGVGNAANITCYENIQIELPHFGISIPIYAGFTLGLESQGIGLLGQAGFFERFNVSFHHRARLFQIEVPDPPQPPPTLPSTQY